MKTSQLFEDEFSRGYRGRLRALNQYSFVPKLMEDLCKVFHPQGVTPDDWADSATLALAAEVTLDYFLNNHSLLPFFQAVGGKINDSGTSDLYSLKTIRYFGTRCWSQSRAMFCPACIKEDIDTRGYSYWRRSHQLPGVTWCLKHVCQLANSPIGTRVFDEMPHPEMNAVFEFSEPEFLEITGNPIIQRYTTIVLSLLNSAGSIPEVQAQFRIAELVKKHKLRVSIVGKRTTLTDRLLEQVPRYWLKSFHPQIESYQEGEFFYPIDNVSLGTVANTSYVLALAALFDSAEEALKYWHADIDGLPTARKVQRNFGKDYWNNNEMFNLYVEHKGNYRSISNELEISPSYLRPQLIAAGLPGLGLVDINTTAKAILDFHSGMSIESACKINGASREEVEKLIRIGVTKLSTAINEILKSSPSKVASKP